jgi:small subunit ribosomal protein S19
MIGDFKYQGYTIEELEKMSLEEFLKLVNSRAKRHLKRNKNDVFYQNIEKNIKPDKPIRTHRRDIIVVPKMVGKMIYVYNGKEFLPVEVSNEMLGHYLGEFAFTRKRIRHGKAGIGATKSSTAVSVRK